MKLFRALALSLVLVLGLSSLAMAQMVTVMNGTGFTIHQLGLCDSAQAGGDVTDLLGNDTLANGEGLQIEISGSSKGWTLIAVDDEGTRVDWTLDLTGVSKVTLHADATADLQ